MSTPQSILNDSRCLLCNVPPGGVPYGILRSLVSISLSDNTQANVDVVITPTSTNGDVNIGIDLTQPYWLNKWWAVWISYTAEGVQPIGSDFVLSESFQITVIPFSHTITVPAPGFSPANVCVMITVGNTQAEAEDPTPLDTMAEDNRENCFTYPTDFPPAGVDPSSFPGLQAWWDADFLVGFSDGDPVGGAGKEFIDRQGDTNHYGRQSSAPRQPIYKTGIANGKPALLFTWDTSFSPEHYLDLTNGADANSITPAGDYTVICVVKPSSLSPRVAGTIIGNAYAGNPSGMQVFGPTSNSMISYDAMLNPQSNVFADQTDVLGMFTFIRSSGNAKQYWNVNDVTNGVAAVLAGHYSFMGAANGPAGQARWGGYVMEIVIYNTELSLADVTSLYNTYFKPKWGLP